jgi:hypothetical protein
MRRPTLREIGKVEKLYAATGRKKLELEANFNRSIGFVILHSPLMIEPPLLILGMQPKGAARVEDVIQETPPVDDRFALHRGLYKLALMSSAIFGRAKRSSVLKAAQFFDLNFFRDLPARNFPHRAAYQHETENFSDKHSKALIRLLAPRRIVTLGAEVLAKLTRADLTEEKVLDRMSGTTTFAYRQIPITPLCHLSGQGSGLAHFRAAVGRLRRDL